MSSRSGLRRIGPEPPPPPPRGNRRLPLDQEPPRVDLRPQGDRCGPVGTSAGIRPDEAGDGADLISALPDELLREILFRVPRARAAYRTTILSRRWRKLWRHIKLMVRSSIQVPDLQSISLVGGSSVEVPDLHGADSIYLQLQSIPHLHHLHTAGDFNFTDLISRCPGLHALEVHSYDYPDDIRVRSTTIQELAVHSSFWFSNDIHIVAPMLERLSFSGCPFTISIDEFPSQYPCLRYLRVHHPLQPVHLVIRSTTIEKIVLEDVTILADINVEAAALKTFTLRAYVDLNVKMLLLAPAVKNLLWNIRFSWPAPGIHWMWFWEDLNLCMQQGAYSLSLNITLQHPGSDPPSLQERFPLPNISVLKLTLHTNGHAYGAMVSQIIGIFSDIQMLHLHLKRDLNHDKCRPRCSCGQPENWIDQDISLRALEVVEIKAFGGKCCEVDFLKLLFRCAPLMKRVTVIPCPYAVPTNRACKEICNLFKAYPSVKCYVYDSCGKKVVYGRSAYASRCR